MEYASSYDPITAGAFAQFGFPEHLKCELVHGIIRRRNDRTPAQAKISSNVLTYLDSKLRGTDRRPYGFDTGIRVTDTDVRYPDVSVCYDSPATYCRDVPRVLTDPIIIVEVCSVSTGRFDETAKLGQYRHLPSLDTIVFVDPEAETARVMQRLGPQSWRDDLFAQPHDVMLPALDLTIPHTEIFARD